MKAMEAPEKIYLTQLMLFATPTIRSSGNEVEYVRKDAFIENAETYLKEKFANDVSVLADGVVHINFETAINNFINYMKGE